MASVGQVGAVADRVVLRDESVWVIAESALRAALGRKPSVPEINDYKEQIIAANGLKPPYIIRPDDKLKMPPLAPPPPAAPAKPTMAPRATAASPEETKRDDYGKTKPRTDGGTTTGANDAKADELLKQFAQKRALEPRSQAIGQLAQEFEANPAKQQDPAFLESLASRLVEQFRGLPPEAAQQLEKDPNVAKLYQIPGVIPFLQAQQIDRAKKAGKPLPDDQIAAFRQGLAALPKPVQDAVLKRAGIDPQSPATPAGAAPGATPVAPAAAGAPKGELEVNGTPLTLEQGLEVMRKANEKAKQGTVGTKSASLLAGAASLFSKGGNAFDKLQESRDTAVNFVEREMKERMKKGSLTPEERKVMAESVSNAIKAIEATGKIREDLAGIVRNAVTTTVVIGAAVVAAPVTGGGSLAAGAAILGTVGAATNAAVYAAQEGNNATLGGVAREGAIGGLAGASQGVAGMLVGRLGVSRLVGAASSRLGASDATGALIASTVAQMTEGGVAGAVVSGGETASKSETWKDGVASGVGQVAKSAGTGGAIGVATAGVVKGTVAGASALGKQVAKARAGSPNPTAEGTSGAQQQAKTDGTGGAGTQQQQTKTDGTGGAGTQQQQAKTDGSGAGTQQQQAKTDGSSGAGTQQQQAKTDGTSGAGTQQQQAKTDGSSGTGTQQQQAKTDGSSGAGTQQQQTKTDGSSGAGTQQQQTKTDGSSGAGTPATAGQDRRQQRSGYSATAGQDRRQQRSGYSATAGQDRRQWRRGLSNSRPRPTAVAPGLSKPPETKSWCGRTRGS